MKKWIPIVLIVFLAASIAFALVENQTYTQEQINQLDFSKENYSIHQETPFVLNKNQASAVFSTLEIIKERDGSYNAVKTKFLVEVDYSTILKCDSDDTKTSNDCLNEFKKLVLETILDQKNAKIGQYNEYKTIAKKNPLDLTLITITDQELNN